MNPAPRASGRNLRVASRHRSVRRARAASCPDQMADRRPRPRPASAAPGLPARAGRPVRPPKRRRHPREGRTGDQHLARRAASDGPDDARRVWLVPQGEQRQLSDFPGRMKRQRQARPDEQRGGDLPDRGQAAAPAHPSSAHHGSRAADRACWLTWSCLARTPAGHCALIHDSTATISSSLSAPSNAGIALA